MWPNAICGPWIGFAVALEFSISKWHGSSATAGVLCRHLSYAYKLTGERGYLEVGRQLLRRLAESQDWSDDPKRRGAVGMSPMYLSLLFYGVPHLLSALQDAGMDEWL